MRQHNLWPYCWNCATSGSVAQIHPRMSSIAPEQCSTMTNQPSLFHSSTMPAPLMFDGQSMVLYVWLQYGSLLPYDVQEWDIPFILIELSRLVYLTSTGDELANVEMTFMMTGFWGIFCPMSFSALIPFSNLMASTILLPLISENGSWQKTVPARSRPP
jgi:hypothetical protein